MTPCYLFSRSKPDDLIPENANDMLMSQPISDSVERLNALPAPRQTPYGLIRAAAMSGSDVLPAESDVVVIGGGICGALTAWFLARRGVSVTLCEKAEIGCESSSRAFGWVTELMTAPFKVALAQRSKALWRDIQAAAGDLGFRQDGIAYLADSADELEYFSAWLQEAAGVGDGGNRMLTADEVAQRYPGAARAFAGALLSPSDGSVEPVLAATVVAEAARRMGARVVTGCAVRGLDLQAGRVAGVLTERGRVRTSTVLCAANVWSRLFCGNHGIDVPQLYVIMTLGRTEAASGPVGAGGQEAWAWRKQIDGGYTLGGVTGVRAPVTRDAFALRRQFRPLMDAQFGSARLSFGRDTWRDWSIPRHWDPLRRSPFERHRILSGEASREVPLRSLELNQKTFPGMAGLTVAETWAGTVVLTPDNSPIVGPVASLPGLHLFTGCGYGFSWGPALAQMSAELIMGETPDIDPAPFRLERFYDGSPIIVTH